MAHITITDFSLSQVPPGNQTCTIQYRLTSDPDVPGSYTLVSNNVLVLPSGHLPTPVQITGLLAETSYTVKGTNNCGGAGFEQAFVTPIPTCPAGYTLSPDHTYCYKETSVPADYIGGGSAYTICYNRNDVYNTFPCRIMKHDGMTPGYGANGVPLAGAQYTPTQINTGTWWYNFPTSGHGSPTIGPLNRAGIWPCDAGGNPCINNCPPIDTDVGFSRQFIVPTSKWYYIGVGADNQAKIQIQDGISGLRTIFDQDPSAINTYFGSPGNTDVVFKSWLIYPVYLHAGPNIISMTAQNTGAGSPAVMAAEIYDATEAQIVAATQYSDLTYIFSTDPTLSYVALGEDFQEGNYSCAAYPGSSLVYNAGPNTYTCVTIETVPPTT